MGHLQTATYAIILQCQLKLGLEFLKSFKTHHVLLQMVTSNKLTPQLTFRKGIT